MHQETIRDFLIGRATPREETFQRLLGAGWLQDLVGGLEDAIKKLRSDEVDQCVGTANTQLDARMQEARRLLEEKENAARRDGLKEPWEDAAAKALTGITEALGALCGQLGIQSPELPDSEPLSTFSERLRPVLQNIRGQGPARVSSDLSTRKTKLELARGSYDTANSAVKTKGDALQATDPQLRTREQVRKEIDSLKQQSGDLEGQLGHLSREHSVMQAALAYFSGSVDVSVCPACLRDGVPEDVVALLTQRLEAQSTAQEKALKEELDDVEKRLRRLNPFDKQLEVVEGQLSDERRKVELELGRQLGEDESPLQVIDAQLEVLNKKIDGLSRGVQDLQNAVTEIENTAKRVSDAGELISAQRRVESLGEIRQTSEWQEMIKAQQALARREQGCKLCCGAIKQVAAKLAQHNLDRARQPITRIYRELTRRADFPDIAIDPEKKYAIEVSGGSGPHRITAILNQTDLDALAFAVVGGMATTFPEVHDLDFVIFDDPSQGMDPDVTCRLADVISTLAETIQIVVATPSLILFEKLKKSTRAKRLVELEPRDSQAPAPYMRVRSISGD
jgi:DNA repair exonuclease SbcCD ATPase subunit